MRLYKCMSISVYSVLACIAPFIGH